MVTKVLAALVLAAMKTWSDSYDRVASADATAKAEAAHAANPEGWAASMIDYSEFYRMDQHEAAEIEANKAGYPDLAFPVYLLMTNSWNDAQMWAEAALKQGD